MSKNEAIREVYCKYLEQYCRDNASKKLPQSLFDLWNSKHITIESLFQDLELRLKTSPSVDAPTGSNPFEYCDTMQKKILITGLPGSGKTYLASRIAIALLTNDMNFLEKHKKFVNDGSLPVFLSLDKIDACFKDEDLLALSFRLCSLGIEGDEHEYEKDGKYALGEFIYRFFTSIFPDNFKNEVSKEDFCDLLTNNKCTYIFEGIDEVKSHVREILLQIIFYLKDNVIITCRTTEKNELFDKYMNLTHCLTHYEIMPVTNIGKFARNFYKAFYGEQHRSKYEKLILDLEKPYFYYCRHLFTSPLTFSMLFSTTLLDFRLPENKALLYEKFLEVNINQYSRRKGPNNLGREIKKVVSFLALSMILKQKSFFTKAELEECVEECFKNVLFRRSIGTDETLAQLIESGFLENPFDKDRYSFTIHKNIVEFLAANALILGYDVNFANQEKDEIDLLLELIDINREVLVFYLLLSKDHYEFEEILNRILMKTDDTNAQNVAFSLIYENAPLLTEKHTFAIIDFVFKRGISEDQFNKAYRLINLNNDIAQKVYDFVKSRAIDSFQRADDYLEFGYAFGMLEVCKEGDPFKKVENFFMSDNQCEIYLATQVVTVLSWCFYADVSISNHIKGNLEYSQNKKFNEECHYYVKKLLLNEGASEQLLEEVALALRESALFFWKQDGIFDDELFAALIDRLNNKGYKRYIAVLLSIFSIDNLPKVCLVNDSIKEQILKWLDEDINEKIEFSAIYRFRTALTTGVLHKEEDIFYYWAKTNNIYQNYNETANGPVKNWYQETAVDIPTRVSFQFVDKELIFTYKKKLLSEAGDAFLLYLSNSKKEEFTDLHWRDLYFFIITGEFEILEESELSIEDVLNKIEDKNLLACIKSINLAETVSFEAAIDYLHDCDSLKERWVTFLAFHFKGSKKQTEKAIILRALFWKAYNIKVLSDCQEILTIFYSNPALRKNRNLKEFLTDQIRSFIRNDFLSNVFDIAKAIYEKPYKTINEKEHFYVCSFVGSDKKTYHLLSDSDRNFVFEGENGEDVDITDEFLEDIFFNHFEAFKERNILDFQKRIFA